MGNLISVSNNGLGQRPATTMATISAFDDTEGESVLIGDDESGNDFAIRANGGSQSTAGIQVTLEQKKKQAKSPPHKQFNAATKI